MRRRAAPAARYGARRADLRSDRPVRSGGPSRPCCFDFHGTIAQVEDPVGGCSRPRPTCGATLDRGAAPPSWPTGWSRPAGPAGRGRAGSRRTWPRSGPTGTCTAHAHRAAYTGLAATVDAGIDGLADALYERLLRPDGWLLYADTVPTLQALHARRGPGRRWSATSASTCAPLGADLGFADLVDEFVPLLRGRPLQAGPGDLPAGLRGAAAPTRSAR